jgi:uncharacterized protein
MSISNAKSIKFKIETEINKIRIKNPHSKIYLEFFGDEPIQKKNLPILKFFLDFSRLMKIKVMFVTNGIELFKLSTFFIQYHDVIQSFTIGLDGPKLVHNSMKKVDSFKIICKSIDLNLKLKYPLIKISCNVNKNNLNAVPALLKYIKQKNDINIQILNFL